MSTHFFSEYIMAGAPETSISSLELLAHCNDELVRRRVCENSHCSVELLCEMADDCSPEVRIAVCHNSSTPVAVLQKLLDDPSVDVRYSLSTNYSLPLSYLKQLMEDENPYVARRATKTLSKQLHH